MALKGNTDYAWILLLPSKALRTTLGFCFGFRMVIRTIFEFLHGLQGRHKRIWDFVTAMNTPGVLFWLGQPTVRFSWAILRGSLRSASAVLARNSHTNNQTLISALLTRRSWLCGVTLQHFTNYYNAHISHELLEL